MLKSRPGTNPHRFSTRQPLILPPKLNHWPTAHFLYFLVFTRGSRVETVPDPNPNLMAQLLTFSTFQCLYMALELKLSLTLTLWLVQPTANAKSSLPNGQCNLLLMQN